MERAGIRWLGLTLLLAIGTACPFNPVIPNARVICTTDAQCPSGFTCQKVEGASITVSVCCKEQGCKMLMPADIKIIEDAAKDAGARDTARDAPDTSIDSEGDLSVDSPLDLPGGDGSMGEVSATCGNGRIESPETCDPISSCPTSCPQIGCETFELRGAAATCNAVCEPTGTQKVCKSGDSCCPAGCATDKDTDCSCTCGNSVIEPACGEVCDPLSTCPTTCPQVGCMLRRLSNKDTCQAQCVNERPQTECIPGDGCCPAACNANNDSDCMPKCGNGVVEAGEKCDGNCPTTCPAMGCQTRRLQGTACTAECVNATVIDTCTGGDGCCAAGCTSVNDSDCNCRCGNGVTEPACNETCDGNCPTTCPAMGCQLRTLQGAANMCNVKCVNASLQTMCMNGDGCCPPACNANNDNDCTPTCGNSVVEAGEKCDPPSACQTQSNACVPDKDNEKVRSGSVAACTFVCTTTARPCRATTDTFCPTACAPCTNTCAAGQDIDCKLANGSACTSTNQCMNGFCSDGVCCNTACSGSCDVCTGGTCALRGVGAAGVPSCSPYFCAANSATCPTTCSVDANCATTHYCATTCQLKKTNGTACTAAHECGSGLCVDGYCCNGACSAPCDRCDRSGALGMCVIAALGTVPSPGCNSDYACNGASTACPPATCGSNANCLSGTTCQGGTCQACRPAGGACASTMPQICCSGACMNFNCL